MVSNTLLFLNLGSGEVLLILFCVLLLFGSKSLPSLARGLGQAMREMNDAVGSVKREIQREANKIETEVQQEVKQIKETPENTHKT